MLFDGVEKILPAHCLARMVSLMICDQSLGIPAQRCRARRQQFEPGVDLLLHDKKWGIRQSTIKASGRINAAIHEKDTAIDRPIRIVVGKWHWSPSKHLKGKCLVSDGISSEGPNRPDHESRLKKLLDAVFLDTQILLADFETVRMHAINNITCHDLQKCH